MKATTTTYTMLPHLAAMQTETLPIIVGEERNVSVTLLKNQHPGYVWLCAPTKPTGIKGIKKGTILKPFWMFSIRKPIQSAIDSGILVWGVNLFEVGDPNAFTKE